MVDGGTKLILDKNGDGNGQLRIADLASTTNSNPANVFANSAGQLFMSTADRNVFNQDITVNGVRVGQGGDATAQPESTALGVDVLAANVSGSANTGIGSNALRRNTSGFSNTAVGVNALTKSTEGNSNTALGWTTLGDNISGSWNVAIGRNAGNTLTTGDNNICIGYNALPSAPDVSNEVTIGNDDVAKMRMGNGCAIGGEDTLKNTVLGIDAYQNNTVGMFSTAIGHSALNNSTNAYNTAIGYNAGGNLTTGSGNTCIGYQAQPSSPDVTNEVTLGGDDVTLTRLRGKVLMTGESSWITSGSASPNVFVNPDTGELIKTTTTFYSTEEMDKKLEIIEKLEARLTKLEARIK